MHNKLMGVLLMNHELRERSGDQVHVDGKQHSIWCSYQYCWFIGLLGRHLQNEKSFVSRWLQDFRATSYNCASQYDWAGFHVVIHHLFSWRCMRRPLSTSTSGLPWTFRILPGTGEPEKEIPFCNLSYFHPPVLLYTLKYIVQSSILSQIFDFSLGEEVRWTRINKYTLVFFFTELSATLLDSSYWLGWLEELVCTFSHR